MSSSIAAQTHVSERLNRRWGKSLIARTAAVIAVSHGQSTAFITMQNATAWVDWFEENLPEGSSVTPTDIGNGVTSILLKPPA